MTCTTIKDCSSMIGDCMGFRVKVWGAYKGCWIVRDIIGEHSVILWLITCRSTLHNTSTSLFNTCLPPIRSLTFFSSPLWPALVLCMSTSTTVCVCAQDVIFQGPGISTFGLGCSCKHCSIGLIDAVLNLGQCCFFSKMPNHISRGEFLPHLMSCSTESHK